MPELTPDMQLHLSASRKGDTETVRLVEEKWKHEAAGQKEAFAGGLVAGIGIGLILALAALCFGYTIGWGEAKFQAVDHGYARYHPTTGQWEWIDKAMTYFTHQTP